MFAPLDCKNKFAALWLKYQEIFFCLIGFSFDECLALEYVLINLYQSDKYLLIKWQELSQYVPVCLYSKL